MKAYGAVPANAREHALKFYTNAPITNPILHLLSYDAQGNSNWELLWSATSATQVLIEFGAHIAVGTDRLGNGVGYGAGLGAADINGGPYHVSIDLFDFGLDIKGDDTSLGSQDNQLQGASVLVPPVIPTITTQVKNASDVNITEHDGCAGNSCSRHRHDRHRQRVEPRFQPVAP